MSAAQALKTARQKMLDRKKCSSAIIITMKPTERLTLELSVIGLHYGKTRDQLMIR